MTTTETTDEIRLYPLDYCDVWLAEDRSCIVARGMEPLYSPAAWLLYAELDEDYGLDLVPPSAGVTLLPQGLIKVLTMPLGGDKVDGEEEADLTPLRTEGASLAADRSHVVCEGFRPLSPATDLLAELAEYGLELADPDADLDGVMTFFPDNKIHARTVPLEGA